MNEPALSVIIPVYNSGNYVLEAVESVLSQDCDVDFEILLVNDHSTDSATLEALTKLQDQAANIHILDNTGRQGPAATRNVGIRAARGNWIGFLDSDDVWTPGSLKARWQVANGVPGANWIAGHYLVWNGEHSLIRPPVWSSAAFDKAIRTDTYMKFHDSAGDLTRTTMLVWTSTTLIRKSLLDAVRGFREDLIYGEDWFLFMNLAVRTDLFFVPTVVAHMRRQHDSLTTQDAAFSPLSYRAQKLAYFDTSFRNYRREIRWLIKAINRSHSDHHRQKGNRLLAAKHAMLALLWVPNDIPQLKVVARRLANLFSAGAVGR